MNADGRMWVAATTLFNLACISSSGLSVQHAAPISISFFLPMPTWILYLCIFCIATVSLVLSTNPLVIGRKARKPAELPTYLLLCTLGLTIAAALVEKLGTGMFALIAIHGYVYIRIFIKQGKLSDTFFSYSEVILKKPLPNLRTIEEPAFCSSTPKDSKIESGDSLDNPNRTDIHITQPKEINSFGWYRPLCFFKVPPYSDQGSLPYDGRVWPLAMIGSTGLAHLNIFECDKFKPLLASIGWSGHGY